MLDVVFVGYYVALDVGIVVVCCCCIHPLHGNVLMCRNYMILLGCRLAEWWLCYEVGCVVIYVVIIGCYGWVLLLLCCG